jgi:RNA polymerase sigma-70 factor (ECF subfamily)
MNGTMEQLRLRACGPNPLVSWSDEQLLLSYRSEPDPHVFEELVRRYEKELFGYLRHYLGDAEAAEDVFQQTFLHVHLKCDQFEPGRKVRPWLYTIATNQAIDSQRYARRHRMGSLDRIVHGDTDDDTGVLADLIGAAMNGPDDEAEMAEQHENLRRAVDALPEACREAVVLVYFQGLKYREAAEILSLPVGTVKSRVHIAIEKLTETLSMLKLPN